MPPHRVAASREPRSRPGARVLRAPQSDARGHASNAMPTTRSGRRGWGAHTDCPGVGAQTRRPSADDHRINRRAGIEPRSQAPRRRCVAAPVPVGHGVTLEGDEDGLQAIRFTDGSRGRLSSSPWAWSERSDLAANTGDGHDPACRLAVASQSKRRRSFGFWLFIVSNVLWTISGLACTGIRACRPPARTLRSERPRSAQEPGMVGWDPSTRQRRRCDVGHETIHAGAGLRRAEASSANSSGEIVVRTSQGS